MKVLNTVNPLNSDMYKVLKLGALVGFSLLPFYNTASAKPTLNYDTFEYRKTETKLNTTPRAYEMLAPNPKIIVAGEAKLATIVIDTDKNKLYHYDKAGKLLKQYNVATGKKSTPTDKGIRKVSWIENYPYRTAPARTRRRRAPIQFGPKIIVIGVVNQKTGEITHYNGEFIHGTNKPQSIGTHASLGCVRMNNTDIEELAAQMEKGMYVVIK